MPAKVHGCVMMLSEFSWKYWGTMYRHFLSSVWKTIELMRFLLVYTPSIYRLNFLLTIGSKSQNT